MNKEITIILVAKNGGKTIGDVLAAIFRQKSEYLFKVTVIDSGSTDRTLEIVNSFSKVNLVRIEPREFGHGKTRKLGANLSQGDYVVFINQDAIPKNEHWLDNLLNNFNASEKVAGVYSRHIPRDDCHLFMQLEIAQATGPIKMIKKLEHMTPDDVQFQILNMIRFSTVSCAIKKDIFNKHPFNENIIIAEDQDWSKRVLEAGYEIIYEPSSMVVHSHNYTLKEFFSYHYKCAAAFNSILGTKKKMTSIFLSAVLFPFQVFKEIIAQTPIGIKKKYKFYQIINEALITFAMRFASLLGNIKGNLL